jgi:hypothetical protein
MVKRRFGRCGRKPRRGLLKPREGLLSYRSQDRPNSDLGADPV